MANSPDSPESPVRKTKGRKMNNKKMSLGAKSRAADN